MDIVQKFIKASLREANRSEASIAYNTNLSYYERLAIILAKSLNGKILKKNKYDFSIAFDLPQNYSLKVYQSNAAASGYVSLNKNNTEIFDKSLSVFEGKTLESYSSIINEYAKRYNVPIEILTKAFEYIFKIVSITSTFNNQKLPSNRPNDYRKSTIVRQKIEQYKKEYAYYKDLFIKSGAISEEDLAKYIISIEPGKCDDYGYDDDDSKTFNSQIAFIFKDRTTRIRYKFIYDVSFSASATSRYSPGDYWEPPMYDEWLTGDVYDGIEAVFYDLETDALETNEELEGHLINIIDNFANSGMLLKYIKDNLEDITGWDVR